MHISKRPDLAHVDHLMRPPLSLTARSFASSSPRERGSSTASARSEHLVTLVDDLTRRGVGLKILAGQGASLDTTTANGKLVFGLFAALAEFERELIIERTRTGL